MKQRRKRTHHSKAKETLPGINLEMLTKTGGWALKTISAYALAIGRLASLASDQQERAFLHKVATETDDALGLLLRETTLCRLRALESRSSELVLWAIGETLAGCENLPGLLKQYEAICPEEFQSCQPDGLGFQLAEMLIALVSYFEKESEKHPERFILIAREHPHWPALVTRHKAGYRKRFERIAARLQLGKECPIESETSRSQYRLETPVCGLIWEEFMRDWIRVSAGVREVRRARNEEGHGHYTVGDQQEVDDAIDWAVDNSKNKDERVVWASAFSLGTLNKRSAVEWANKVVIPYLHLKFPDWQKVDALAKFVGKKGGDAKAEREIRRALRAMAHL